jgi:hypothetical protein
MGSIDTTSSTITEKLQQYGVGVDKVAREAGWVVSEDNDSPHNPVCPARKKS